MVPSASIPAVRQNRSKLTETASQALPTAPIPVGGEAINVVLTFFMALLSFVDSTPRAYRLKASNAAPPISTFPGAIPAAVADMFVGGVLCTLSAFAMEFLLHLAGVRAGAWVPALHRLAFYDTSK